MGHSLVALDTTGVLPGNTVWFALAALVLVGALALAYFVLRQQKSTARDSRVDSVLDEQNPIESKAAFEGSTLGSSRGHEEFTVGDAR